MEQFYKLLRAYNTALHSDKKLPGWHKIFTEENMPIYADALVERVKMLDKELHIVEIGSGLGDITALLIYLGFKNIIGIERDKELCKIANDKLKYLFNTDENYILCEEYPIKLQKDIDVYIQVNNVYVDGVSSKIEYLDRIKKWIRFNNNPKYIFVEFVDKSFKEKKEHFPEFIRMSEEDVLTIFPKKIIEKQNTYIFPHNSSSKCLYSISNIENKNK